MNKQSCDIGLAGSPYMNQCKYTRRFELPSYPQFPYRECHFFFRRQGFRMITLERQGGSFRNIRRSWVMVKGRRLSFSDPAQPPNKAWCTPKHPQKSPPPKIVVLFCVSGPQEHFSKKNIWELFGGKMGHYGVKDSGFHSHRGNFAF